MVDHASSAEPRRTTIVEFTGVPGAGKSFLAARLLDALLAEGVLAHDGLDSVAAAQPVRRRVSGKLALAVSAIATDPISSARTVFAVARSGQPPSQLVRRSQNALVVRRSMRRARRRPGVHVFDQGLVQELQSVAYAGRWSDVVDAFGPGRGGAGPDLVVSVRVEPELAVARLAARADAGSRLDGMSNDERLRWLAARGGELMEIEDRWLAVHAATAGTRRLVVEVADDRPETLAVIVSRLSAAVRGDG